MKFVFLRTILLTLIVSGCNKDAFLYESVAIKGTVWTKDEFVRSVDSIASGATVFLSENSKAVPYLIKVDAAKDGSFNITHRPTGKRDFFLVAKFTDSRGILFEGYYRFSDFLRDSEGNVKLTVIPQYPQGIIKAEVVDSISRKEVVNGAEVFVFENKEQANSVKTPMITGKIASSITNNKGAAFFYNLPGSKYYLIGRVNTGRGIMYTKVESVDVNAGLLQDTKIQVPPITLKLEYTRRPDFTVSVEYDNQPLAGVTVHLFSSEWQAQSIADMIKYPDSPPSSYAKTTDTQGKVQFSGLEPITFYVGIRGDLPTGQKAFLYEGSINVSETDETVTIP